MHRYVPSANASFCRQRAAQKVAYAYAHVGIIESSFSTAAAAMIDETNVVQS